MKWSKKRNMAASLSLVLAVLLFVAPAGAFATPSEIEQKRQEAAAARSQLDSLSAQLETAGEEYAVAHENLVKTKEQVKTAKTEVAAAQERVEAARGQAGDQLEQSYRSNSSSSYLEVIMGSTSFNDFVTRLSYLNKISAHNAEALNEFKAAQEDLEAKQATLSARLTEEKALESQAKNKQAEIQSTLASQNNLIASLDSEVTQLIAEQRAKEEAAAQKKAEETARQQAKADKKSDRGSSGGSDSGDSSGGSSSGGSGGSSSGSGSSSGGSGSSSGGSSGARKFVASRVGSPHPEVVATAKKYLGVPYVWGGTTPKGFDCSGFVQYVYAKHGINIPRTSRSQFSGLSGYIPANRTDLLEPGDLVFFGTNGRQDMIHHVGIYVGGGSYIHAPQTGDVVKISGGLFGKSEYVGACRP